MIIRPNAGFIIPSRRFVDVGMPRGNVTAKGRYKLIKYKRGIQVSETPWFDNLILDSGLNRWGTGAIIAGAAIGTGSSAADAAQTALETQTHYTSTTGTGHNVVTALGSSPYNNTLTVVYRTTLGALNGNYSEVGVGWASGSMFSRALILDGVGSPTTISVAVDEQLDIVYQLSVFPPLTDTAATVSISGVDYDVDGRAMQVNSTSGIGSWNVAADIQIAHNTSSNATIYAGAIGAITGLPSGEQGGTGTVTTSAYSNNSLQRTASVSYSLSQGNVTGGVLSSVARWTQFSFQYQFDPAIPKDGTKTLVLNYSVTWARRP